MSLSRRDRRALIVLLIVLAGVGFHWATLTPTLSKDSKEVKQAAPISRLQSVLKDQRKAAAAISGKKEILQRMSTQLAVRENSFIQAHTAAQAQAQLLEILKTLTHLQTPPLQINQIELNPARPLDDAYAEVSVSITTECTIDELLNLIADLTSETQIIATDEISLSVANQNLKTIHAHVTVTGLVHRILIAEPRRHQT